MNPQRTGSESDDSNPASSASPTPTIRDIREEDRVTPQPASMHTASQTQASSIGMGRPEVSAPLTCRTCHFVDVELCS